MEYGMGVRRISMLLSLYHRHACKIKSKPSRNLPQHTSVTFMSTTDTATEDAKDLTKTLKYPTPATTYPRIVNKK